MLMPRTRLPAPAAVQTTRRSNHTKLDEEQVREIRRLAALGANRVGFALIYDVSVTTIKNIEERATWADVPQEPLPKRRVPPYRPPNAKLTAEDHTRICHLLLEDSRTLRSIAAEFGVSTTRISQIKAELRHRLRTRTDWRP